MVNRVNPPFDNPDIRKAMSLALDRKPFNTHPDGRTGAAGRRDAAEAGRRVGHAGGDAGVVDRLRPGRRKECRRGARIMQKLGYSEGKPLKMKIQTRNLDLSLSRGDPDRSAEEDLYRGRARHARHARWFARMRRRITRSALNVMGVGVDDPDGNILENYACGSERNYTQYCNAEVDKLLPRSRANPTRKSATKLVWDIERQLDEDAARPIILHSSAGNCWQPHVKNFRPHDNSQYNNLRFEDVWLDK